jgi:hypothetical protein
MNINLLYDYEIDKLYTPNFQCDSDTVFLKGELWKTFIYTEHDNHISSTSYIHNISNYGKHNMWIKFDFNDWSSPVIHDIYFYDYKFKIPDNIWNTFNYDSSDSNDSFDEYMKKIKYESWINEPNSKDILQAEYAKCIENPSQNRYMCNIDYVMKIYYDTQKIKTINNTHTI